jgi:thymidylate kinase
MRPDQAVDAVHPALARVFAALDGAGVAWCLLRGEAAVADPGGDVDMLVAAGDMSRLDAVLAEVGFLCVRAWGVGGHRGYVGRDPATDRVLELDVEWCVAFGPSGHFAVNWLRPTLRTDAAAALLARRCRVGPLAVLDDDDAFWALLLHCIVDKGAVAPRHAARLVGLATRARPDEVLGRIVTAHCPPGWDAERVLAVARDGRWPELVAVGARLPGRATPARRVAALARGLRRLGGGWPRRGLSVAVMGPDGAGKSTLASAVAAGYGPPARVLYMGLWQGEGQGPGPALPAAMLAAARRPFRSWRRAAVALYHQARGRLVVFDRHPYDALLPPVPPHVALKRVFFTLLACTVPAPSLVLVLDLPAEVTARRRPEEDPAALAAVRADYLALAARLQQAVVLDADRPPDALRAAALDRIWQAALADRVRRS